VALVLKPVFLPGPLKAGLAAVGAVVPGSLDPQPRWPF
jgi:hypothetical protein